MAGVDIDWTHNGDTAAARAAAKAMVAGYRIAYPAVLVSRHTQKRAVDMTIAWKGTIAIADKAGKPHAVAYKPPDVPNPDLYAVGKSYGVIKLVTDKPHWSDDGH